MKKNTLVSLVSFLLFFKILWAQNAQEARLLTISKSGRTFVINFGSADQMKVGDVANFYSNKVNEELRTEEDNLPSKAFMSFMGVGELKQIFPHYSVWRALKKGHAYKNAGKGDGLFVYLLGNKSTNAGKLKLRRYLFVNNKHGQFLKKRKAIKEELSGIPPKHLSKKEKEYLPSTDLAPIIDDKSYEEDVYALTDTENIKGVQVYAANDLVALPSYTDAMKKILKEKRFSIEKTHQQILRDTHFDWEEFYGIQKKMDQTNPYPNRVNTDNAYAIIKQQKIEREEDFQKLEDFMERRGRSFSENMSDDELYRLVHDYSESFEEERLKHALRKIPSNSFHLNYGMGTSEGDTSWELGFEVLLYYFSKQLEKLSLDISLGKEKEHFLVGGSQVSAESFLWTFGPTIYLFNSPLDIREIIFYSGIRYSFGSSTVYDRANNGSNYNVVKFPLMELGFKYRLFQYLGFSWNVLYGVEKYGSSFNHNQLSSKVGMWIYF